MKSKILLGSVVVAALFAQQAFATAPVATAASASILNSKHDISSGSTSGGTVGSFDQVCVYCHTPHGADTAKGPLWNRVGTAGALVVYGAVNPTGSMDGEVLTSLLSGSAACMTCHDGATALDAVINSPGSADGSYDTTPSNLGTKIDSAAAYTRGVVIGSVLGAGIGLDLSDDHPIGVPYAGGGFGTAGGIKDLDFVVANSSGAITNVGLVKGGVACTGPTDAACVVAVPLAADKFWVDTNNSAATKNKRDLPLFVRTTFATGAQPSVECGTCHDVHNPANGSFLRIENTASAVCFACHVK